MGAAAAPLLVGLAVILVTGCAEDEPESAVEPSVVGVPWILAVGLDVEGWESVAPSAAFDDGTMAGSTGCNHYTGSYAAAGETLELGAVAATRMACAPPADAVERAFLAQLERVAGWRLEDDELVLVDDDDEEALRFREATPVGDWEATAIRTATAVASPLPGTTITARFADDGTLSGSAGCNSYRASYSTDRGTSRSAPPPRRRKRVPRPRA